MTDEQGFLAAIRAEPDNRVPRLAYADWLEERADPRTELVRVEDEMGALPAYVDRYWELKPRRNELRAAAPADWVRAMGYGVHYDPLLGDLPAGWKERWRLAREFVERWFDVPMRDVSAAGTGKPRRPGSKPPCRADVRAVERKLGRELPASLREWVALCRDVLKQKHFLGMHRTLNDLYELDGYGAIFLDLSEPSLAYTLPPERFEQEDPIVTWIDKENDVRKPVPCVSALGLEFVLRNTDWPGHNALWTGFAGAVSAPAPRGIARHLRAAFPSHTRLGDLDIFEARNLLVVLGPDSFAYTSEPRLYAAARHPLTRAELPECLRRNFGKFVLPFGIFRE